MNNLIEKLRETSDLKQVMSLMEEYQGKDWQDYCFFEPGLSYTRNLVFRNQDFNLMVICWAQGQSSRIHDHPTSNCVMKILAGQLTEVRFDWPSSDQSEMVVKETKILKTNDVGFMSDSIGLHRMENHDHAMPAISLHLYSPPYNECTVFDQRTSQQSKSSVCFTSVEGKRVQ